MCKQKYAIDNKPGTAIDQVVDYLGYCGILEDKIRQPEEAWTS